MKRLNKKAVSELVSFTLLTLLVAITSVSSYYFVSTSFEEITRENDYTSMKLFLETSQENLPKLLNYDQSSGIYFISFQKGAFIIEENSLQYQSELPFSSQGICIENFCYENNNGFERLKVNFSQFNFTSNITLIPGSYMMQFISSKNNSELLINIQ
ncbi:MAG: hypothetical protein VX028_03595 [Nanoarchaeota archaeon]|nr:hypothetical protein [Nanoarchaeota archaeon]